MSIGKKQHALVFIFITILLDVTGLGLIIPVLPPLIMELIGGGLSEASFFGGWLQFVYAAMQFAFAPVVGALSDRFGRRPVLLFALLGFGLDYIVMGLAPTIGWLFLGRILAGVTGASITTAGAYIADVSPPEKRAQNFGLIGAGFGLGFIIGPVAGGLLGQFGPRVPFFAAAALTLLNVLYGYFVLPESLPPARRRAFEWRRANPMGSLLRLRNYPVILGLIGSLFLIYLAGHATQSTWTYYTMEKFAWTEKEVGYSLGFVGLMVAIVQGGLTRVLIPRLGPARAVFTGLAFNSLCMMGFALAGQSWMMYAIIVPFALGGLAGPSLQGIISNQVPADSQGELQGALTGLVSLTAIIGPPLMTHLFGWFTSPEAPVHFPGAPFFAGSVLVFFAILQAVGPLRNLGK